MTSYHEFNKYDKAKVLVDKILGGMDVAVITDAGTPGISDPGEELVKQCRAQGYFTSGTGSMHNSAYNVRTRDKKIRI